MKFITSLEKYFINFFFFCLQFIFFQYKFGFILFVLPKKGFKMAKKDYIPSSDNDKAAWLKNFAAKLSSYSATLKLSEGEIQSVKDDALMFSYTLDCLESIKMYYQQTIVFKDSLRDGKDTNQKALMPLPPVFPNAPVTVNDGIFVRVRKLAQNIKTRSEYTEDIGKALGIIAESVSVDYNILQPTLQAFVRGGKVVVKWKKGTADSINIYVKRGNNDFVYAGNASTVTYNDPTPLPAEAANWIYRGIYVVKDVEIGNFSEEESILVKKFV